MEIPLDESTITIIVTIISITLGIISKHFHSTSVNAQNLLVKASEKAELGALLIKKLKDANADTTITNDEYTGIVKTVDDLISIKN